mmetsp:Transcript_17595/g.53201  ORF Transcript_17595/g.53201 Transcript_17595/m.53201 type:complete len:135 (-) Transcript_17595:63-467(-)|eukprot:scaffold303874_cov37-Tisochrysis_lutea.AAC.1
METFIGTKATFAGSAATTLSGLLLGHHEHELLHCFELALGYLIYPPKTLLAEGVFLRKDVRLASRVAQQFPSGGGLEALGNSAGGFELLDGSLGLLGDGGHLEGCNPSVGARKSGQRSAWCNQCLCATEKGDNY